MQMRRRFKQTTSLKDRLSEFANGERAKAEGIPDQEDPAGGVRREHQRRGSTLPGSNRRNSRNPPLPARCLPR
jgi:hypothetical protein